MGGPPSRAARPESLCPDAVGRVAERRRAGRRHSRRSRSGRTRSRWAGRHRVQPAATRSVSPQAPGRPRVTVGCPARVDEVDVDAVRGGEHRELVAVDDVVGPADRVDETERRCAGVAGPEHRHERARRRSRRPRAARARAAPGARRTSRRRARAARTASPTARPSARKVETSPSGHPLDGQLDPVAALGRRDGVAPRRRVAVGGGEPHVDVLTRAGDRASRRRRGRASRRCRVSGRRSTSVAVPPRAPGAQSPWYRCSRHGSP